MKFKTLPATVVMAALGFAGAVSVGTPASASAFPREGGFIDSSGTYTYVRGNPTAINNAGVVTGSNLGGLEGAGFIDSGGTYTTINVPGATTVNNGYTTPIAINDAGVVTGSYYNGLTSPGFIDSGGAFTTLNPPGAIDSMITGINDAGAVAGYYFNSDYDEVGFVYSGGTYTNVNPPGSIESGVTGINDSGAVTGQRPQSGVARPAVG